MKAAVIYDVRKVRIDEIPIPEMGADEVQIKIDACAVCPTGLREYTGARPLKKPLIGAGGHEPAGTIVKAGKEVEGFEEGDKVLWKPPPPCGKCYYCRRGYFNKCPNRRPPSLKRMRPSGAFSEYVVKPASGLAKLPDGSTHEEGTFVGPLANVVHGVNDLAYPDIGDNAVVVGAGPNGLLFNQVLQLRGCNIIQTDLIEDRLKAAKRYGAIATINVKEEDPKERVMELTDGKGAEIVIVATGNKAALEQGISLAAVRARVLFFAGTWPATKIEVDPNRPHYDETIISGVSSQKLQNFYQAYDIIKYRKVDLAGLVTHRYPLEETQEGIEATLKSVGLKKMVLPWMNT
jgi:L-iditol 2-dehydrogenase